MSTFMIAGKDFYQYVAYRLKKDGLGYTPTKDWYNGCTDTKTFIKAILPKTSYDFLVYAHELGHCKSKQLPRSTNAVYFRGGSCDNTLQNEYNAWVWAIRYMRKLKIVVSAEEITKALKNSFLSYTKDADNKRFANDLIEKLNNILGINLELENTHLARQSERITFWISSSPLFTPFEDIWQPVLTREDEYFDGKPLLKDRPDKAKANKTKRVITPASTNQKHKPWMDLMDKKRKHSWKNGKNA